MTTSAIYLLPTGYQSNQRVCFYIARDGYPESSADYFYKMYHSDSIRSHYADCFFRANPDAEFATDEEENKDAEFRYAINQEDILSVWKKSVLGNQKLICQGLWYEFVVRHEALYQLGVKVLAEKPNLWLSVSSFELMEVTT